MMTKPKTVSENITDYGVAKTDLQAPLVVERKGKPLAVLLSIEEYQRLRAIAASEKRR